MKIKSTYINIFGNKNSLTSMFDLLTSFVKSKVSCYKSDLLLEETFVPPWSNNSNP